MSNRNDEWVAVSDRLPDPRKSYWVTSVNGTVHLGYMNKEGTGFRRKDVVAWMPYPEQPEPARFTISLAMASTTHVPQTGNGTSDSGVG